MKQSDEKFHTIDNSSSNLYYFSLGNNENSYKITFDTIGQNNINKLDYGVGIRGNEGRYTFLVNQWHSRTYHEAKEGAKDEIEQARRRKNDSIGKNGNLSSIERDSATAKVEIYARQATHEIDNADSLIKVDEALNRGLGNINGVNPVGRENAKEELRRKAQEKKTSFNSIQHITEEEKRAANEKVDSALQHALGEIDKATTKSGVDSAKNAGLTAINGVSATANANAKQELDRKAQDKKAELAKVPHLTREELTEANGKVDEALRKAKEEVDKAKDQASVDRAKTAGIGEISKVSAQQAPTARLTKETHPHQVMVVTKQVQIVEGMRLAKETDQLHLVMVVKAMQITKISLLLQALQLIQEIRRVKLLVHLLNRGEQEMRQK